MINERGRFLSAVLMVSMLQTKIALTMSLVMPNISNPARTNIFRQEEISMKNTVRWFLDMHYSNQLDLEPPYQRRSVWTLKDRRFFLDTIFRNYPSPAVFLHKDIDQALGKMIYHVVDGKQRLETIVLFTQNNIALDKEFGDPRLNGKKWKLIENDPDLKTRFYNYVLPIEFIDTDNDRVINEVFDRLNRTSRKLERQELRHARFDGWFIKMTEAEAQEDEWERLGVVTKARMRRMKDVQSISDLLIVLLKYRIIGCDHDTLDDLYAEYDSPHETVQDFNEEGFKENLRFTKNYILSMEAHNRAVTVYAKGLGNFYSLWAFVALNQHNLDFPEITSERYAGFMEKVEFISMEKDMINFSGNVDDTYSLAYNYFKNSVKSGNDQQHREARNSILKNVLLSPFLQESPSAVENDTSTQLQNRS
jgi:hypothetical protein